MIGLPAFVERVPDLAAGLPEIIRRLGGEPVIVTDVDLAAAGVCGPVETVLGCEVMLVPGGEPVAATVGALARSLRDHDADVVVAVGGGSVIDTAKLAARLVSDPEGLSERLGSASPFPPVSAVVVAVPTTSGSGAEVTRTAIVSEGGRKRWAWDDRLRPEVAVLAPELTATVPRPVAVAAGLDAFVHAVEAATGQRSTTEIAALGFEAAAMLLAGLPVMIEHPDRTSVRSTVMEAATAAGCAIDLGGTGIGHAVGHALGSLGVIPHGLAVMLGLRAGLAWTLAGASDAYTGLARRLVPGGAPDGLIAAIDEMLDAVGFCPELEKWPQPTRQALAAEMASIDHRPMRLNNARPISEGDIADVAGIVCDWWSG
ncbi:MAG TPA: iron-containing alcohol dehydrogenase [Acidimicrobiia bacterium]|nr:iron-containing alcohol dehydrogenase [Acidimicrobiia bacterium]